MSCSIPICFLEDGTLLQELADISFVLFLLCSDSEFVFLLVVREFHYYGRNMSLNFHS